MSAFRVVIVGGGVAALEGLLRLRRLAGDAVEVTLVAPNDEFFYKPLAVNEPFGLGGVRRYSLGRIVQDSGADWVRDEFSWVDVSARVAHTSELGELPFDALLLAMGAKQTPAFNHVMTLTDADLGPLYSGVIRGIESGNVKSVAFVAPDTPVWPLPLYEIALMTAERAVEGGQDVELSLTTPESAPLAAFGQAASDAVGDLLDQSGITVYRSATAQISGPRQVRVFPHGVDLHPDRVVALPLITGPAVRGLASSARGGFIPIDGHLAVPETDGRVFAAGDATMFPVKHGGLSAQQADTAAAGIARLSGVDVDAELYRPELRGMLLTGREPLFIAARVVGQAGFESEVSREPLWSPPEKIVAQELGPYLADLEPTV